MCSDRSDHFIFKNRILHTISNPRGISLIFIIFLMLVVSMSVIGFLTFGAKLRIIEKDRITLERLEIIRDALQRYYLSHHNLPEPVIINESKTVPTMPLKLPQQYRFDSSGEFIHFDWKPHNNSDKVDILGSSFKGKNVAAIIVAAGPNKKIESEIDNNNYDNSGTDDIVEAISLNAEAIRIASRAVALMQAAAKAYDNQFENINNDGDYNYDIDIDDNNVIDNWWDVVTDPEDPNICLECVQKDPDEIIENIDEDSKAEAIGGFGWDGINDSSCVRYGILENDPSYGRYSLDNCVADTQALDISMVFGLGERYVTDPWGNPYQWGNEFAETRYQWRFFSMGPDGEAFTADDIRPTTDLIMQ